MKKFPISHSQRSFPFSHRSFFMPSIRRRVKIAHFPAIVGTLKTIKRQNSTFIFNSNFEKTNDFSLCLGRHPAIFFTVRADAQVPIWNSPLPERRRDLPRKYSTETENLPSVCARVHIYTPGDSIVARRYRRAECIINDPFVPASLALQMPARNVRTRAHARVCVSRIAKTET